MNATWQTLGKLCRALDWSPQRLLYELQNGRVHYRTVPEGYTIDYWLDPYLRRHLSIEASEISIPYGTMCGAIVPPPSKTQAYLRAGGLILGIEVLAPGAPTDAEMPSPSASAPAASPAPRRPSDAAVEQCFRAIMKERPNDPPSEDDLFAEMKQRLGASPGRDRLRQLRREIAPQWKRPRGHPRNFNSAKKSAV
jgi:hypothetical protein